MKTIEIRITGNKLGPIWMPTTDCTKEFDERFRFCDSEKNIRSLDEIDCLRDALLKITNDGDFQHCEIELAFLTVTKQKGLSILTRSRILKGVGENADCFVN